MSALLFVSRCNAAAPASGILRRAFRFVFLFYVPLLFSILLIAGRSSLVVPVPCAWANLILPGGWADVLNAPLPSSINASGAISAFDTDRELLDVVVSAPHEPVHRQI